MALPTLLRRRKRFHTPVDVRLKTIWRKIMQASAQPAPVSTKKLWAGIIISALDRKSTRLNSSHLGISYAVFCLKKKKSNKKSQPMPTTTTNTYDQPPETTLQ